jgi:hypothetical protein
MTMVMSPPKDRINFVFDESKMKFDSTTKCELPDSIEIAILDTSENADPSIKATF